MSATSSDRGSEQGQGGLFGESELPQGPAPTVKRSEGAARLLHAERHQVELRPVDLDATLAPNHRKRLATPAISAANTETAIARQGWERIAMLSRKKVSVQFSHLDSS